MLASHLVCTELCCTVIFHRIKYARSLHIPQYSFIALHYLRLLAPGNTLSPVGLFALNYLSTIHISVSYVYDDGDDDDDEDDDDDDDDDDAH